MTGLADASLVLALIRNEDALHARARAHVRQRGKLAVPLSVGIELLHVARKRGVPLVPLAMEVDDLFELESRDVHTADERLLRPGLPTVRF